jgi:hypothetical protein
MVAADRQRGFVCISGRPYPIHDMSFRNGLLDICVTAVGPCDAVTADRYTIHDNHGVRVTEIVLRPGGVKIPPLDARTNVTLVLSMDLADDSGRAPHT